MSIGFLIGEMDQHQMELSFDQNSGDLQILMDGIEAFQDSPMLTAEPVKRYELWIGECEKHRLAFRMTYGNEPDDPEVQAMTEMRLMVTAIM